MSVREQAEMDIKESLKSEGKCFLAFHEELNPIIDKLVEEQSHRQLIASML
jgi:hypothetical protein